MDVEDECMQEDGATPLSRTASRAMAWLEENSSDRPIDLMAKMALAPTSQTSFCWTFLFWVSLRIAIIEKRRIREEQKYVILIPTEVG